MDRIEAIVTLPEDAGPLSDYERLYAESQNGRVRALYYSGSEKRGQRRWISDYNQFPLIADGGCGVIWISFDPKMNKVLSVTCNGVA